MQTVGLVVQSYFDGARLFEQGPFTIEIVLGLIRAIHQGDITAEKPASDRFDQVIRVGRTFSFDLSRGDWPLAPMLSGKQLVVLSARGEFGFKPGGIRQ
ncbi:MAG: hypothetical protein ACXWBP_13690, partial [Limisphaerales bacterium]